MDGNYYCRNPLDTISRMIDTARRLDLGFFALRVERVDEDRYLLHFALSETGTMRAKNFTARIALLSDLEINTKQA